MSVLNFFRNIFKRKKQDSDYYVSEYEKEIRNKYKDKWIAINGSNDPALEAIVNAAWNSNKPVMATWDDEKGLVKED